jgi:hypothetical protein
MVHITHASIIFIVRPFFFYKKNFYFYDMFRYLLKKIFKFAALELYLESLFIFEVKKLDY